MMGFTDYDSFNKEVIYEKIRTPDDLFLTILSITHDKEDTRTQIPKHWHRGLEIIVPKEEGIEAWIDGNVVHVNPNDFLIINSTAIHSCKGKLSHLPYACYAIQIKYEYIKTCFPDIDTIYFVSGMPFDIQQTILKVINNIIDEWQNKSTYSYLKLHGYVNLLLSHLLENLSHQRKNSYKIKSDKQKELLTEVLTYLDAYYDEKFNATAIAGHFHISYGHLASLFKTNITMSMREYVNTVRIKKSVNELLLTDFSITQIALSHGFVNVKSFYREFRKVYNQTPKEYRNQYKGKS